MDRDTSDDGGSGARRRGAAAAEWGRAQADRARARAARVREWAEVQRQRSPAMALAFDVADRDRARLGGLLAGALAYRFFLWLLPFSLFMVGSFGALASIDGDAPDDISRGVGLRGFLGDTLTEGARESGWWIALLIGLSATLYAGMGAVRALRISHAAAWGLRPARGGNPLRASVWLTAIVIAALAIAGAIGWVRDATAIGGLLAMLATTGLYFALWLGVSARLPHRAPSRRALVPGAVVVAVGIQGIQLFTAYYLAGRAERASSIYGTIGAALTLLLWLFLIARLIIGGAILNAQLCTPHEAEEAV